MASTSTLVDRVKIVVQSSGTGPFQLGAAVAAYRGVEALADGVTYSYAVESGAQYEIGTGVYIAATSLLVRTPLLSSNGGAPLSFPANVELNFTALAQDIIATGATLPIVQSPGNSTAQVMSQRATTEELVALGNTDDQLTSDLRLLDGAVDHGVLSTGVTELVDRIATGTVNPDGTERFSDMKWTTRLVGSGNVTELRPFELGSQYYFNGSGLISTSLLGYARIGLDGNYNANFTSVRGIEFHVANEGNGTITAAQSFQAGDVDFRGLGNTTGTGTIGKNYGYRSNNMQGQGDDAGRVTQEAIGFQADDISEGAPLTASFRSEMSSGTGKYAFASTQGAPSSFQGKVRVGQFGTPTDQLEVMNGFMKVSTTAAFIAPGGFHEAVSDRANFTIQFTNTHNATPFGINVRFLNASPNNTSQTFFEGRDSTAVRMAVFSNGNVVNQNGVFGTLSDRRLKTNIVPASSQWDDIKALEICNFNMRTQAEGAPKLLGVIAQDVLETSPGCVETVLFDGEEFLGVKQSVLYMKALKVIQEMQQRIEQLEKSK